MHARPPTPAPTRPPDYVAEEQALWRANAAAAHVNNNAVSSQRVATYANNFGYATAAIETEIANSPMFAAAFAKSPVNAGFEKKVAHRWLTQHSGVQIIDELPKDRNALYVANNGVITTVAGRSKPSKALNFRWHTNGLTFYALHKYTPNSGGTQKRQFEAEQKILENFNNSVHPENHNNVLIVIVDGHYYKDPRYTHLRIDMLRNLASGNRPKSFAVHIEDVPWAIAQCP